jgi:hypothetical protein
MQYVESRLELCDPAPELFHTVRLSLRLTLAYMIISFVNLLLLERLYIDANACPSPLACGLSAYTVRMPVTAATSELYLQLELEA